MCTINNIIHKLKIQIVVGDVPTQLPLTKACKKQLKCEANVILAQGFYIFRNK